MYQSQQISTMKAVVKAGTINFIVFLCLGFIYLFLTAAANQLNKPLFIIYYIIIFCYFIYFSVITSPYLIKQRVFNDVRLYHQKSKQITIQAILGGFIYFYIFVFRQLFFNIEVATTKEMIQSTIYYLVILLSAMIAIYFIIKRTIKLTVPNAAIDKQSLNMQDTFLQYLFGYIDESDANKVTRLYQKLAQLNRYFLYIEIILMIYSLIDKKMSIVISCFLLGLIVSNLLYVKIRR